MTYSNIHHHQQYQTFVVEVRLLQTGCKNKIAQINLRTVRIETLAAANGFVHCVR